MRYTITPQSAVTPPVTTSEARDWLRVEDKVDGGVIHAILLALSERIEEETALSLTNRDFVYVAQSAENVTATRIVLPRGPVTAVASVKVYDDEGEETTLTADSDYYVLDDVIRFSGGQTLVPGGRIEVAFTAGYASMNVVPADVKLAIRRFCYAHYDVRLDTVLGSIASKVPIPALDALQHKRKVFA